MAWTYHRKENPSGGKERISPGLTETAKTTTEGIERRAGRAPPVATPRQRRTILRNLGEIAVPSRRFRHGMLNHVDQHEGSHEAHHGKGGPPRPVEPPHRAIPHPIGDHLDSASPPQARGGEG